MIIKYAWLYVTDSLAVIRLKQVEHIKNERNTLAAVAGHPFITTMITSFSDRDCLYMLVRDLLLQLINTANLLKA